jgi:hypothetical protein
MATQRNQGVIGLWSDPFPAGDASWAHGSAFPPLPTGPAAQARFAPGVVTIETPPFLKDDEDEQPDDAESTELKLPNRHRQMEFMGTVVKVRCNPTWMTEANALLLDDELDEDKEEAFTGLVARRSPMVRAEIAAAVCPPLRTKGNTGLARTLEDLADNARALGSFWS